MKCAVALLLLTSFASADEFVIATAEEKFSSEVAKAESDMAKVKQAASAARLKVYKEKLVEATKAGDFDKAMQLKSRIEALESEPEAKAQKRPRPKDTVRFDGHAYALVKDPVTWHVAKQRCEEMGGHLVVCDTAAKMRFISDLCRQNEAPAWIGCSREVDETWRWVNGATAVLPGAQINNSGNIEFHMMWSKELKNWDDAPAGWKIGYVCEWDR